MSKISRAHSRILANRLYAVGLIAHLWVQNSLPEKFQTNLRRRGEVLTLDDLDRLAQESLGALHDSSAEEMRLAEEMLENLREETLCRAARCELR